MSAQFQEGLAATGTSHKGTQSVAAGALQADSQAQRVEVGPLTDGPLLPDPMPDWRREELAAEDREEELRCRADIAGGVEDEFYDVEPEDEEPEDE